MFSLMELCVERERKYKNSSGDFLYALTRDTKILNLNPPPLLRRVWVCISFKI